MHIRESARENPELLNLQLLVYFTTNTAALGCADVIHVIRAGKDKNESLLTDRGFPSRKAHCALQPKQHVLQDCPFALKYGPFF